MYLPVPGFEPTSSEFLDKCATRQATVADSSLNHGHINMQSFCIISIIPISSVPTYIDYDTKLDK